MEKSWKFQGVGGGGSTMKPLGKENPGGWGVKLGKTLRGGGGGMDIFWNHTMSVAGLFTIKNPSTTTN